MELPDQVDDVSLQREREKKDRLYEACKDAARFYFDCLRSEEGKQAREYFARRGLDGATVSRFGLGYAPQGWDRLKQHLQEKGHREEDLVDAGLLIRNGRRVYDAYRNRVVFPIIATTGKVLGFGARAMDGSTPKYINTGDTPIYNKRANLYALNIVKAKKQLTDIVMVEGYMDVISLHMAGIDHAVASLGTALTQQQARLLKRYAPTVYICYDGDAAGQNATLRGLDILAAEGLQVRVIVLPEGQDPDDFVRQNGKDAFLAQKDRALTLNEFKIRHMQKAYDLSDPNQREQFAVSACKFVASLQPVEQDRYYEQIARITGFTLDAVRAQGERTPAAEEPPIPTLHRAPREEDKPRERRWNDRTRAEWGLLWTLLQDSQSALDAIGPYGLDLFSDGEFREFAVELVTLYSQGEKPDFARMAGGMETQKAQLLSRLLAREEEEPPDLGKYARDCVATIRRSALREHIQVLQQKSRQIGLDKDEKLKLVKEIQNLSAMLKQI